MVIGRAATKKVRCPTCDSTNILYVKRRDGFWCRKCGHHWPRPKWKL